MLESFLDSVSWEVPMMLARVPLLKGSRKAFHGELSGEIQKILRDSLLHII